MNHNTKTFSQGGANMFNAPTMMQQVTGFLTWKTAGIVLIIIVLTMIGYYAYTSYAQEKTVFHANRENMTDNEISNKTANIMLFYVDWCPHCKTAKPEWEALKSEYEGKQINGYTIIFTEYNCTEESDEVSQLMDKYKIEGYPTIKLVKDNQVIEYDAKPTKTTMEQYLHSVL
jgi:thiol-disulfide isomerase/thioredoxin